METFLTDFQRRTGITVDARLNFQSDSLPGSIGENAFRVLQEALTNVAKHAHVERVSVMLEEDEESLQMTVKDEGAGFDPQQLNTSRLGILGMQERVELLGGRFELQSAPEQGTRIEVSLPLHNGAQ